ncbi:MAG: TraM recognition domain-containing protein [Actinomycetota bacterium]|nr:TraM recognition domain-containing protein [Actinomycetota bacterium]
MSYQPRQRGGSGNTEGYLIGGLAVLAGAVVVDMWGAAQLAARFNHGPKPAGNPFRMISDMAHHSYQWPAAATGWAIGIASVLVSGAVIVAMVVSLRHMGGRGIDRAARNVTRDRGLNRYSGRNRKVAPGVFVGPGPVIGKVVPGKRAQLRATWEDMLVVIAGPRTGKTTAFAIPAMLDAPGAVIVTSNKRDIVDSTRGSRETVGVCWVLDPQGVAGAGPVWWWNPLSYVTDVRSARKLAAVWTNASKEPDARVDAYFDNAGQELLSQLLLAAAAGARSISTVFRWLSDSEDDEPVALLRQAGHALSADGLRATINLPEKQKAGVYGTAAKTVSFLSDPRVLEWVEDPGGRRPQFSPGDFVASKDTLYSLSREGEGSSGPLVTALTAAVLEAAERQAAASVGGRLTVPLLAVLDEVANVCRWRELPDLYSHYGSRGIVVLSILQSWAQGESCWGEQGMRKLWDAANVKVFAGGSTDTRFLEALSQLYGHYDRRMRSRSQSAQGSSTSWSNQRERVFSVDDLSAMPAGRAAVGLSGTRPVLVQTVPWMERKDAEIVRASLARYGSPDGHRTATVTVSS